MSQFKVTLAIEELACDAITVEPPVPLVGNNTRDEVYFLVSGNSSRGLIGRRLPTNDDYYEFEIGHVARASDFRTWTNRDQTALGRPVLWAGELNDNEGAVVFVTIGEQDNRNLGKFKRALLKGKELVQQRFGGQDQLVDAALAAADELISIIPEIDRDDVIGAFVIHLRNVGGELRMAWVPWLHYAFEDGKQGATTIANSTSYFVAALQNQGHQAVEFDFKATEQGRYRGVVAARIVDHFIDEQFELLGTEIDRCGAPTLYVSDRNGGHVAVSEGQSSVPVDIPGPRFHWHCGDDQLHGEDKEWTTAPTATDRVLVSRGSSRKITWDCYRRVSTNLTDRVVQGLSILLPAIDPIYAIQPDGTLLWYRHDDYANGSFAWTGPRQVGTGWQQFKQVFAGGDGVIYAIQSDGVLLWYRHDDYANGSFAWTGPRQVGTDWQQFKQVFAGGDGVIYAIQPDGTLLWYRHDDYANGGFAWTGPHQVGTGWQQFKQVFAGDDRVVYAIQSDGKLLWYRHNGGSGSSFAWTGPRQVGTGWQQFKQVFAGGDGVIYAIQPGGTLLWYRHDDYANGSFAWTGPRQVGIGWQWFKSVLGLP